MDIFILIGIAFMAQSFLPSAAHIDQSPYLTEPPWFGFDNDDQMVCLDEDDNVVDCKLIQREPSDYADLLVYDCLDGTILETEHLCDNIVDCADGSDEMDCDGVMYMTYGRKNPNSKLLMPPPIFKKKKTISASTDEYDKDQRARQNPKDDPEVNDKVAKQKDSTGSADPDRAQGEDETTAADKRDDGQPPVEPPKESTGKFYNANHEVCPVEQQQQAPAADYLSLARCPAKLWPMLQQLVQGGHLSISYQLNGTGSSDSYASIGLTELTSQSTALITTDRFEQCV